MSDAIYKAVMCYRRMEDKTWRSDIVGKSLYRLLSLSVRIERAFGR
jgi:hypothetical protein